MKYKQALSKCMDLCSRREYCTFDIKEKLYKWEVSDSDIEKIIDRLINEKFISHQRYCNSYVNDKFKFNDWGKIKIAYYLKNKQIESSYIESALNSIDWESYLHTIEDELKRKAKQVKAKTEFEKKSKIAKSIIAKGFESNLVFDILKKTF